MLPGETREVAKEAEKRRGRSQGGCRFRNHASLWSDAAGVLKHNYIAEFVPPQGKGAGLAYPFRRASQFFNWN